MQEAGREPAGSPENAAENPAVVWRILLTEDDAAVRERLAGLIKAWPGGDLVAACATLGETLKVIADRPIDVLITDLKLPDGNGIEAIRALRATQPNSEAMVISVLADEYVVVEAIEAGASGYLLKDADTTDIIEAVTDLMAGRSPISSRIARVMVKRLAERGTAESAPQSGAAMDPAEEVARLTNREMDILWAVSKGFTYSEIAERLGISSKTVPVHVRNIYRKLQVRNRSEAVFEATRQGLIRF